MTHPTKWLLTVLALFTAGSVGAADTLPPAGPETLQLILVPSAAIDAASAPPATLPDVTAPSGGVPSSACDTKECNERHGRILAGAGVYIVKPYFQSNPGLSFFVQGTGPGSRLDVRHHMDVAPMTWLGYMNEDGLGVRARWWYLREGTDQTYTRTDPGAGRVLTVLTAAPLGAAIILNNPDAVAFTTKFQLQVADFEVVKEANINKWNLLLSGGLAYTNITQNYDAYAVAAGGAQARPLTSGSRFVGVGPVIALEARHPICNTCMNLFASTRTRALFGSARQTVFGGEQLQGAEEAKQDTVIGVQELELGLEYDRTVGRTRFFNQVAMVGQQWFGAGNATRSSRGGPPTTIPNFSSEDNTDFGLFGLSVRFGFDY